MKKYLGALMLFGSMMSAGYFASGAQDVSFLGRPKGSPDNITRQGISLESVLNDIQRRMNVSFNYNSNLVKGKTVEVDLDNISLQNLYRFLQHLLNPLGLSAEKISDRQYVIYKERKETAINHDVAAVTKPVHQVAGVVTAAKTNDPLPGVTVSLKGNGSIGTITDSEGKYVLSVPGTADTLVFSYLGYETREVAVDGKDLVNVSLDANQSKLNELVVVGYGKQKRSSLTAAISTLNTDAVKDAPTGNISNTLNGRVSGIIAAQNSGKPGSDGAEIHIRGVSTTGNSAPLIIVDGIPGNFTMLDPNTIATFTVLKDAAAVAPYGMAGANGVILVTTKKGKIGKPVLSYSGYMAYQNPTTLPKLINAYDYVKLRNVADVNAGQAPTFSDEQVEGWRKSVAGDPDADYDKYPSTDILDAMVDKNTPLTDHNISISGGSENTTYFVSLGYLYQQGLWNTIRNKRYNVVANIETKPTKTTTIALSLKGYNSIIKQPQSDFTLASYNAWWPTNGLQYSNGFLANNNGKPSLLPLRTLGSRSADETGITGQLSVEQQLPFIKGLSIKGVFSYVPTTDFTKNWSEPYPVTYNVNTTTTPYTYVPVTDAGKPGLSQQNQRWKDFTYQGFVNYHNTFGKHDITALAVIEARQTKYDVFYASRSNYELNIHELNLGSSDPDNQSNGGSSSQTSQVGYVYRVSYAYANKYLFEASGRYDGHYYFAPGRKYGFFPSFSAGWRLSEEPFIRNNLVWIDDLKIRGSWGESGNLAGGPFQYSSSMAVYGSAYSFDGSVVQGAYERVEANPFITWERAMKTDIGIDATLWNGLLSIEADYFAEKRNNMLVSPGSVVSSEYGIGIAQENAGIMNNKGIDLTASSKYTFSNGLRLGLTANFTYAKNKLIKTYENPVTLNDPNRSRTGRPLNSQFGLVSLGLFQLSDDKNGDGRITKEDGFPEQEFGEVAPGDIHYADINGDGKVDASDETYIGRPILPQIIYGFAVQASYKGFDLNVLFQGAAQSNIYLGHGELLWPFYAGATASQIVNDDYWTPDNPDARYPRPFSQGGNSNNQQESSFWFWNSSYLRLKNLELGYTLPASVLETMRMESIRIYVSGQNILTWSPVKEFIDPEMGQQGGGTSGSNTRGWYYPQQKVLAVGLNVTF
ncbi:MAG TPA: SusC/RagA family TonB-linked outer membrane protein [Chitinophagaceae bacterium]|nr:SusC/RagA family TonB-linked outer membrane protein [Chitinophagaceae bacterium]